MKILFLGDVVAKIGLNALKEHLQELKDEYKPNLIIVNAENTTNGRGLSLTDYKELMKLHIDCLTMGNHTFRLKGINDFIDDAKIVRPLNMIDVKGNGYLTLNYNGKKVTIINLIGTVNINMQDIKLSNPFVEVDTLLNNLKSDYIIVDMHAETTSEKLAMAHFLDGKVDVVVGTHTHVQTSDARVLPKGTEYITDLGMCGSYDSILGVKSDIIVNRLKDNDLSAFVFENGGEKQICGALFDLDNKTIKVINKRYK